MGNNWRKVFTAWAAVLVGAAAPAFSETLIAPSSFIVYQGDITQWLTEQIAPYLIPNQILASQINFVQPYNTIVHNPEWQGATTFTWTKNAATNVWAFDAQTTNLVVQASEFEVHDTILETIGGSVIPVSVNSVCQNMALSMPGVWKVHGELPMAWSGSTLTAPLQNFLLTPSSQVPVLTLGTCTGPTGLAAFLNQRIVAGFASSAQMQTMAAAEVQSLVNAQLTKVQAILGKPYLFSLLGANISFTPTTPSNLPNGTWILDGSMVFTGGGPATTTTLPKEYTSVNLSDADASGFAFSSVDFWPAVLNFAQGTGMFEKQFPSSSVSGFTALMSNGAEQWWVWPDLLNFATSTVFGFFFETTQAPHITAMSNIDSGGVQFELGAPIDVLMSAPTKKGTLPYVEFASNAASIQLNAQAASSGALQVNYTVDSLPLTYRYRPEYYAIRKPTDTIYTNDISSSVMSSYTNQVWSYSIPATVSPFPGDSMYFKNLFFGPATFRVEMGIKQN